jgi:hypothetical protein
MNWEFKLERSTFNAAYVFPKRNLDSAFRRPFSRVPAGALTEVAARPDVAAQLGCEGST